MITEATIHLTQKEADDLMQVVHKSVQAHGLEVTEKAEAIRKKVVAAFYPQPLPTTAVPPEAQAKTESELHHG